MPYTYRFRYVYVSEAYSSNLQGCEEIFFVLKNHYRLLHGQEAAS